MAKSLGQIHTVNWELPNVNTGNQFLLDTAGELSKQLNRNCRMMSNYNVVGIDITLDNLSGAVTIEPQPLTGKIKYYSPTRGRCEALRTCYRAFRNSMKAQGVNTMGQKNYDFRPLIRPSSVFQNGADIKNVASFNGQDETVIYDPTGGSPRNDIFDVYNGNIQPKQATPVGFNQGFGQPFHTLTGSIATSDYVLNEGTIFDPASTNVASLEYEEIPFTVAWGADTTSNTSAAVMFEWRPDPALYLAILTGQIVIEIDEFPLGPGPAANFKLDVAVYVAGWKSIVSGPKSRRRRKSKNSKRRK